MSSGLATLTTYCQIQARFVIDHFVLKFPAETEKKAGKNNLCKILENEKSFSRAFFNIGIRFMLFIALSIIHYISILCETNER